MPKKKPYKVDFENEKYKIKEIPLNWQIDGEIINKNL